MIKNDPERRPTAARRRQVETMASYGILHDDIARVMKINPETLRHHYRVELDLGLINANRKVAANLFRMATGTGREALTAAIFWLKCRGRWSEPRVLLEELGKKEAARIAARAPDSGTALGDLMTIHQATDDRLN